MKYKRPRGMQDVIPPDSYKWRVVEAVFADTFERFGYSEIRTPLLESAELFARAVGEDTDIITKEMYSFSDRGGRSLTLRPENTASVVRAYLENGMHRLGGIVRLYYFGPMFRYERPQAGRYRQFHQVGVEAIGSMNPAVDVEVMDVVLSSLDALGFSGLSVRVNSVGCSRCRPDYRKKLIASLEQMSDSLCADCKERMRRNPLRIFDCKRCGEVKNSLPTILSSLCDECEQHFQSVISGLGELRWPYDKDPLLVRGLDYYTRTTFEVVHGQLGAQNALCGGGRYDNLVAEFGGSDTPAVGFSAGLERIISVLPPDSVASSTECFSPDFYVVCWEHDCCLRALQIARTLHKLGRVINDLSLRSLKKQLKNAERSGAAFTVIVESSSPGHLHWKDMASREQVEIRDDELLDFAQERLELLKGKKG